MVRASEPDHNRRVKNQALLIVSVGVALSILLIVIVSSYSGSFMERGNVTPISHLSSPPRLTTPPLYDPRELDVSSWKIYNIETVGLEFRLPQKLSNLGEIQEKLNTQQPFRGMVLCVAFKKHLVNQHDCEFNLFGLTAISHDYDVGRGAAFGSFQGFEFKEGKYYGKSSDKNFELPSDLVAEVHNPNNVEILRIIGKTSPEGDKFPTPGDGWIGAIINTSNTLFPGVVVMMELKDDLTTQDFDQVLSTFRFTTRVQTQT